MVRVRLFGRLSDAAQGQKDLNIPAKSLREILEALKRSYGDDFAGLVLDEEGNIKPFINIFVNNKHANQLQGLDTAVSDGDEVLIIPAIAGG